MQVSVLLLLSYHLMNLFVARALRRVNWSSVPRQHQQMVAAATASKWLGTHSCSKTVSARYSSARFSSTSAGEEIKKINYFEVDSSDMSIQFGDYDLIASQAQPQRTFVNVDELGKPNGPAIGDTVWIRGRLSSVRAKGNACFIVVRWNSFSTVQACHFKDKASPDISKAMIKYVGGLTLESIVDIMGVVSEADVKSCTQNNVEIQIKKVFAVSRAPAQLPFLIEDAARSQADIDASADSDRPFAGVGQVY